MVKKHKAGYQAKVRTIGKDTYGQWRDGVQVNTERVNGHVLTYDSRKGTWR